MAPRNKPASAKKDPYLNYKILVKYLLDPNEARLRKICENKTESEKLKNRALIHLEAFPDLIHKINKFANGSYETMPIISKFTNEEWLEFYSQLLKSRNITNSRALYMPRYNENEYVTFSKNMKKYLDQIKADPPSSQELQCLYVLYKQEVLPFNIFDELIIDNEIATKKKSSNPSIHVDFNFNISSTFKSSKENNYEKLSEEIKAFTKDALRFMKSPYSDCKKCELNNNLKIIIDTNIQSLSEGVDVLFIGQNPTLDDRESGVPMNTKQFGYFRDFLDVALNKYQKFKYACINLLQCVVIKDSEFKPDSCISKCKKISKILIDNLKPKLIVTFGDKPMKYFGIKGTVNKNNGSLLNNVIPTVLPTANMTEKNKGLFDKAWQNIFQALDRYTIERESNLNSDNEFNIDPSKIITKITSDYTILDVKQINNKQIFMFKDKSNVKRYYIQDIKVPVYIKFGDYKHCKFITDEMDQVVYLTAAQLEQLNKKLYSDMKQLTGSIT